jgi:hypothetical protein
MTKSMVSKVYFCAAKAIVGFPVIVFERTTHTFTSMKPVIFLLGLSVFGVTIVPNIFNFTDPVRKTDSEKLQMVYQSLDITSDQLAKDIGVPTALITAIQEDQAPLSQDIEHKLLDRYGLIIRN